MVLERLFFVRLDYPWDMNNMLKGLQEWMFLPDPISKPEIGKIACKYCKFAIFFSISFDLEILKL